jgi:DNA-binding transcriptional ArsR family regulator
LRTIHHPSIDEVELPDLLHALGDPVRLEIVRHLAEHPNQTCGALDTRVAKSTLSHHLKVLREAGVTRTHADGTQRLVSLRSAELDERFPGVLDSVLGAAQPA